MHSNAFVCRVEIVLYSGSDARTSPALLQLADQNGQGRPAKKRRELETSVEHPKKSYISVGRRVSFWLEAKTMLFEFRLRRFVEGQQEQDPLVNPVDKVGLECPLFS